MPVYGDIAKCTHGKMAPVDEITSSYFGGSLTVDQSEPARHGCPICAFDRGVMWERARIGKMILDILGLKTNG